MAKSKASLLVIFLFAICTCSAELHPPLNDRVRATYTSQIGVREKTGNNDGQTVEMYLASVGLAKGNPWCAAFVYWVFNEVKVKNIPKSGYSPSWFPNKNTIFVQGGKLNAVPTRADVFGIWFASKNRIAHVGFIDEWEDRVDFCITVEGNTNKAGSRDGDGVYRKRRLKRQIYKVSRWVPIN